MRRSNSGAPFVRLVELVLLTPTTERCCRNGCLDPNGRWSATTVCIAAGLQQEMARLIPQSSRSYELWACRPSGTP